RKERPPLAALAEPLELRVREPRKEDLVVEVGKPGAPNHFGGSHARRLSLPSVRIGPSGSTRSGLDPNAGVTATAARPVGRGTPTSGCAGSSGLGGRRSRRSAG